MVVLRHRWTVGALQNARLRSCKRHRCSTRGNDKSSAVLKKCSRMREESAARPVKISNVRTGWYTFFPPRWNIRQPAVWVAYNREPIEGQRRMMQDWPNHLDELHADERFAGSGGEQLIRSSALRYTSSLKN